MSVLRGGVLVELSDEQWIASNAQPTFDDRKTRTLAEVYAKSGLAAFTYDFGKAGVRRLDCRSADDKINWLILLVEVRELIAAKSTDPVGMIDADNNTFVVPPESAEAALVAMRAWGKASMFKARQVKDAVLAASDADALAAIDITAALAAEAQILDQEP